MSFYLILFLCLSSGGFWYYRKKHEEYLALCETFKSSLNELVATEVGKDLIKRWFDETQYVTSSDFKTLLGLYKGVQTLLNQNKQIKSPAELIGSDHVTFQIIVELTKGKSLPTESTRQKHNERARESLIKEHDGVLRGNGKYPPNHSQCVACVDDDDRTLVLAGAGTGKTATIMTKTRYLVKTGKALPGQILLLAYNHDAAEEMVERISNDLGSNSVDIKTFHAFGNFILKNRLGPKRTVSNMVDQSEIFNRFVASIIKTNLDKDPAYKEALVQYFVEYAAPIVPDSQFKNNLELSIFWRSHDLTTFTQERVKSGGELKIANLLFYWQIPYAYEARYPNTRFAYKPDFLISDKPFTENENIWKHTVQNLAPDAKSAWIEYFGIDANGNTAKWIDSEAYKSQMESKIELHRANNTELIQLTTADLQKGVLKDKLKSRLEELGFPIRPMSPDQFIKELLNEQSQINPRWRHLLDTIRAFLPLFKDSGLTYDELISRASERGIDIERLKAFIKVFKPVHEAYEEHNHREGLLDFSDMIVETTAIIKNGLKLPYKYVLVDEFQDISRSRALLLQAILTQSDNAKLFAVGDDWQSIYRFSGSDTNYVSHFEQTFGTATTLELDTTYRFPEELNRLTANFVTQNPGQLKKGMHALKEMKQPCALTRDVRSFVRLPENIKPDQVEDFVNKEPVDKCYQEAIDFYLRQFSRKVEQRQGKNNKVLLLGRNRWENMHCLSSVKSIEDLQKAYPNLDLDYKTAHSSKGLEADYVVVIGNDNSIFPSERQSDQIIEAALPMEENFPFAEERRLFYVAMTRAKLYLIMLYDGTRQSVFISELQECSSALLNKTGVTNTRLKCPHCDMGIILKKNNAEGKSYYQCSNYSGCGKFFNACEQCGSPVVDTERGKYCINQACNYMLLHCPQCGLGYLFTRVNKKRHHVFYGCSNWNAENGITCSYTTSQLDGENRERLFLNLIKDKKQLIKG